MLLFTLLQGCPKPTEPLEIAATEDVTITVLKAGAGDQIVGRGALVTVHYQLMVDGSIVDSSLARDIPFEFTMGAGQVIPGWEEGVMGARIGEKRSLIVPPSKGYGSRETGPIPPNSTLFFEIEVLEIKAPRAAPKGFTYFDSSAFHITASGLKYVDLEACGEGVRPVDGGAVVLDYSVFLPDHTLVESTLRGFDPAVLGYGLGQMPDGLEEALGSMTVGCARQVWVPPELGGPIGDSNMPTTTVLILEVALLEVRPPA